MALLTGIFISYPYFNEPGHERYLSRRETYGPSIKYNADIRKGTLRFACQEQIESPDPLFKDLIDDHFKKNKDTLIPIYQKWAKGDKSIEKLVSTVVGKIKHI
jgi:hypothetical protein